MEGLHCLKYLLEIKDFLCKVDLKNACFSVPLCMSSREFVIFSWSGKLYDLLSLFWIRAGSQDIFKTIKGINSSIEVAEHSSSHIFRRYSSDGKNIRGKFNEPRHIDFSASTSGFCHKISSETIRTIRVFRPKTRYPHHDFGNIRGNDRKGNFEMTESPFSPSNHCFGLTN